MFLAAMTAVVHAAFMITIAIIILASKFYTVIFAFAVFLTCPGLSTSIPNHLQILAVGQGIDKCSEPSCGGGSCRFGLDFLIAGLS